jgi:preprotein translocase subunit SecE
MTSIILRTRNFATEVVDEIKKVTWPDWSQLKNSTFVIILFVIIVATIIFLMDQFVRLVINQIMNLFAR